MTTNYHTPIATGATNAPGTINVPLAALDSALSALSGAGGAFTLANGGTSNTTLAVDSATGFVIGATVVYAYGGSGAIEYNTIANISSNTITLTNTPTGAISDNAVIAQVTPDVAAISSAINTNQALTASSAFGIVERDSYNVKAYGAIADGSTHPLSDFYASLAAAQVDYPHATALTNEMDWAAIQLAVNSALTQGANPGGRVIVPTGIYLIDQEIALPGQVQLIGNARGSTTIRASGMTFSGKIAMVSLGITGSATLAHGTRIENLVLDANNIAASVCVYSELIQELSGIIRCELIEYVRYGIWFQKVAGASAQNFTLRDLELIGGASATSATIPIFLDLGGVGGRGIDGLTITGSVTVDTALRVEGCRTSVFERMHFENCGIGMLIGSTTACNGLIVQGVDGVASCTTLAKVSSGSANSGITFIGLNKNSGTNTIFDEPAGITVTDGIVGFYTTGDITAPGGYRIVIDDFYQDNVAASQTDVTLGSGSRSGLSAGPAFIASRAGSVTGIVVYSNAARTAGTLTVEVKKNGAATGLTAVLDGTNTTLKATYQVKGADTFVAGDRITAAITTDGSWAPTTADIRVVVELEQ